MRVLHVAAAAAARGSPGQQSCAESMAFPRVLGVRGAGAGSALCGRSLASVRCGWLLPRAVRDVELDRRVMVREEEYGVPLVAEEACHADAAMMHF